VFDGIISVVEHHQQGKSKVTAGFDDTIAVIQYLLLKAQLPNLYSEYYFTDVFLQEETTTDETVMRFVLGKLGGFIQMMFEDNMEVPIASVKDTFIEATAERESPEDTALIASIFSYIAEVVDKDHSPCEIPDKIRVALQNAAMADHMRPQLHFHSTSRCFQPRQPESTPQNPRRHKVVIGVKSGRGGRCEEKGEKDNPQAKEGDDESGSSSNSNNEQATLACPVWLCHLLAIVGIVIYKNKFHFRKQYSLALYNELKWQLTDLKDQQHERKRRGINAGHV